MKKRVLRLTSTSHDDGVPLLTCKGGGRAATLLQTAVGACSSGVCDSVKGRNGLRCRPQMTASALAKDDSVGSMPLDGMSVKKIEVDETEETGASDVL